MNKAHNLSIVSALRYAFTTYAHHFFLLLCTTFFANIDVGIFLLSLKTQGLISTYGKALVGGIGIAVVLLYSFLLLGLRQITLDLYYKNKSSFSRLFSCLRTFPTFLGASILVVVCMGGAFGVILGLLLGTAKIFNIIGTGAQLQAGQSIWHLLPVWYLILVGLLLIPVFVVVISIIFYPYFILDMKSRAFQAIKLSYYAVRPHLFTIIALIIIFRAINYTITSSPLLFLSENIVWNIVRLFAMSLFQPIELLTYVYVYAHIKMARA
jgi:hypothetical protein